MNEWNTEKLEKYNNNRKHGDIVTCKRIQKLIDNTQHTLTKLKEAPDDVVLLQTAGVVKELLEKMDKTWYEYIQLQNELGLISDDKYEKIKEQIEYIPLKDKYEGLLSYDMDKMIEMVDNHEYYPEKGSMPYHDCKDYENLTRVELGKMVKADLKEAYPDFVFSVTTESDRWGFTHYIRVKPLEVPDEHLDTTERNYPKLQQETYDELQDFVDEYKTYNVKVPVWRYIRD